MVLAAAGSASPDADAALARLCEQYWYPLYGYLRGHGYAPDRAQDFTQAFFEQLLERRTLRHANPERGRFRSFLLASLKNFIANEQARTHAIKRGGGATLLPLEFDAAEGRFQHEPRTSDTPEKLFDRRWAITLLDRVTTRLRNDLVQAGKEHQFEHLKGYLTGDASGTYAQVGAELGVSEGAVKVAVHRLRRQFRDLLRHEIAQTVPAADEIDDEIRHLWTAVAR